MVKRNKGKVKIRREVPLIKAEYINPIITLTKT